ncbi:MAG: transcriptional repressor [Aestuariivirga sp.]|nr:transcriptional repressor [Aestuariivirga sp.]
MTFLDPHHDHAHCTADLIARAERTCERRGSKLTGQRREILSSVAQSHSAVGAYDIIERMAEHGPRPAPITVYRALDFLLAHGLVHKIESRNAFVACSHSHEGQPAALLICETCGTVSELDAPEIFERITEKAKARKFSPAHTMIEMSGTCGSCARAA